MKLEIITRQFRDLKIENMIIKMFEYYLSTNLHRLDENKPTKNREEVLKFLEDLVNYVESGLKKKFSINFIVLISENPNYAVKFEKGYFLGLKFLNFDIIIIKCPFICIPGRFYKTINEEIIKKMEMFLEAK